VKYHTIVADPPWPLPKMGPRTHSALGFWNGGAGTVGRASEKPYQSMSLEAIAALPVESLADADAHLYLWVINRHLEAAWTIARAWGFQPSTLLTWCKAPMGIGFGGAFTITTEHALFCRRGSLPALRKVDSSWWQWTRPFKASGGPAHSQKPEHFLDLVEQVSPGPYVELFSRRHRMGWDVWGDESANTARWAAD
jgi:N6-adenosine-specific RNA methylase IME4